MGWTLSQSKSQNRYLRKQVENPEYRKKLKERKKIETRKRRHSGIKNNYQKFTDKLKAIEKSQQDYVEG
jgi:hypothetical protein